MKIYYAFLDDNSNSVFYEETLSINIDILYQYLIILILIFSYTYFTTYFIFYLGKDWLVLNSCYDRMMNGGYIDIIIWNEVIFYSILLQQ